MLEFFFTAKEAKEIVKALHLAGQKRTKYFLKDQYIDIYHI